MLAKINSVSLYGLEAYPVFVEADISNGLPGFDIVGLPDVAVRESKERVKAAIKNSGFHFPAKRVVINLAPADLKKDGTLLDLPIAVALLIATEQLNLGNADEVYYFLGELSLDGSISRVNGVLPLVSGIGKLHHNAVVFLPPANGAEGALDGRVKVIAPQNLKELVNFFHGEVLLQPQTTKEEDFTFDEIHYQGSPDFCDIKGQQGVKRGLEIAAAGGHNVLMMGVPGSGKTLLARAMPTILPPLTKEEALECTCLYSLAGELGDKHLIKQRPFRAPHHTSSAVSLIGGGTYPKPGEISMAYHGILFLDEMVEFPKNVLQVLRQPMEDRVIHVSRAVGSFVFPADFQLIGASNPCPCGYYGDPKKECTCTQSQIKKYFNRLSGPLLDRIDLQIEVGSVAFAELHTDVTEESSATVRKRVIAGREVQRSRYQGLNFSTNAGLERKYLDEFCLLDGSTSEILERIFNKMHLSARAHDRILKVARTIADLDGATNIETTHILEAVQYRSLDRL
ncbi:MAG: YifB family Mg chelatase-like AAA ATPase [Clostridiales bacterium]